MLPIKSTTCSLLRYSFLFREHAHAHTRLHAYGWRHRSALPYPSDNTHVLGWTHSLPGSANEQVALCLGGKAASQHEGSLHCHACFWQPSESRRYTIMACITYVSYRPIQQWPPYLDKMSLNKVAILAEDWVNKGGRGGGGVFIHHEILKHDTVVASKYGMQFFVSLDIGSQDEMLIAFTEKKLSEFIKGLLTWNVRNRCDCQAKVWLVGDTGACIINHRPIDLALYNDQIVHLAPTATASRYTYWCRWTWCNWEGWERERACMCVCVSCRCVWSRGVYCNVNSRYLEYFIRLTLAFITTLFSSSSSFSLSVTLSLFLSHTRA